MTCYTTRPTHVRVYREETGDECVWHLDGADNEFRYTEEVRRYETFEQACDSIPLFVTDTEYDGVFWDWQPQRTTRIRRLP